MKWLSKLKATWAENRRRRGYETAAGALLQAISEPTAPAHYRAVDVSREIEADIVYAHALHAYDDYHEGLAQALEDWAVFIRRAL